MTKPQIGSRYGRLVVIGEPQRVTVRSTTSWRSLCLCDCGKQKMVRVDNMVSGLTVSCGCLHKQKFSRLRHGEADTRLHTIWMSLRRRCYDENNPAYPNYGGRGIRVCDEWFEYIPFRDWARSNGYSDDLTIDRVNNDGDYCPSNCRWVSRTVQSRNRRYNRLMTAFGETKCMGDWAEDRRCVVGLSTLVGRWIMGWDHERAITQPLAKQGGPRRKH